ncbi:MAG TPA: ABC transporter permease [Gaiellaceae bacterium]|nr:ABC transporter permease [Gaiellaceae bacterium]
MSAEAIRLAVHRPARRLFVHQLRSEQLVFWRSREAAFFIFLFPLLLFVLLGSVYHGKFQHVPIRWAVLAGLVGYGCANTSFAGLAIQLVIRRENGILKRLRSTPLPPATYVVALLVSTLLVFGLQAVALFVMGRVLYGTPFPSDLGSLVATLLIGSAAFAALGTAAAMAIRSAEGSSAVVNFLLLPMAFLSGGFGPTNGYPVVLRAIGDVLPLTYFVKLMNAVYLHGQGFWTQPGALAVLGGWGLAGLILSIRRFEWEPRGS